MLAREIASIKLIRQSLARAVTMQMELTIAITGVRYLKLLIKLYITTQNYVLILKTPCTNCLSDVICSFHTLHCGADVVTAHLLLECSVLIPDMRRHRLSTNSNVFIRVVIRSKSSRTRLVGVQVGKT